MMQDRRSIFAGFGTASMLAAAAFCVLVIGTAVIGYNGWPGPLVGGSGDRQIAIAGDGVRATRIAAERLGTVGRATAAASAAASGSGSAPAAAESGTLIGSTGGGTQSEAPSRLRATAPVGAGTSPEATAAPGDQQTSTAGASLPALSALPALPGGDAAPDLTRRLGESVAQAGSGLAGAVGGGRLGDVTTSTTTVLGDTVIDLGDGLGAGGDTPPPP